MAQGQGYRVDIDALEATVRNLKSVADALDHPRSSSQYNTHLAPGQLGTGFGEATVLYQAHDRMKSSITSMIATLQQLIDDFGSKAAAVHRNYAGQESKTSSDFGS